MKQIYLDDRLIGLGSIWSVYYALWQAANLGFVIRYWTTSGFVFSLYQSRCSEWKFWQITIWPRMRSVPAQFVY